MLTNINLNKAPYFDDFDALKQYYQILYKPGFAVQAREMNQDQTIKQWQIESLSDNIFKKGTIIDGCNFNYFSNYPFAKLVDSDIDGNTIIPSDFVGLFAKNDSELEAFIINSYDGFEAAAPDLKTIYLNYTNSGNTGNIHAFAAGETLTIFDSNTSIPAVTVTAGGVGFSNSDVVVCVPAIRVNCTTSAFANGDNLVEPATGANVEVILATQIGTSNDYILSIKPRDADLANSSVNALAWTIDLFEAVTTPGNTVAATVTAIYGSDFSADIITNGVGKITQVDVIDQGQGFTELPFITVQSANNLTGLGALDLTPRNYYSKVKIAASDAVGNGYAFAISDGIVYQKGFFIQALTQTVIVDKYSNSPNNVVVGFDTREEIVTSEIDTSLLDNALGSPNYTAPGADRLKLTPVLTVLTSDEAAANSDFSALVQWSEGQPFKQNQATQYSRIGDEMSQRTFDESGNFVIDTFQIATTSTANSELEGNTYTVAVDPGQAYISGYKTQTLRNFYIDVQKGTDTSIANNFVSFNYGNYVRVKEVGGLFQFSTGANVALYDTAKTFLSNTAAIVAGNLTPVGTQIGSARARSMVHESGTSGDPAAIYRIYLFDVRMNAGKNFSQVRSVSYGGTNPGIADIVLQVNPSSGANVCVLQSPTDDGLIFSAGVESLKNSNNTTYVYRTIDQTTAFGNNGILTKSIASNPNEFYQATGNLTDSQMKDLYVVPIGNTLTQYTDLVGTISVNTTVNVATGSGTSFFNDFEPGDYVKITANSGSFLTTKVVAVINGTSLQMSSNASFANGSCTFKRVFPKNVPIPFGTRTGLAANVDVNMNILKLGLYHSNGLAITLEGTTTVNTAVGVSIQRTGVTSTAKTANRNQFVKICCGNNAGGTAGPWCLGVPDVFRLRGVYLGNSTVANTDPNVSSYFYIDHNQNQNYLDHSWLMPNPRKRLTLSGSDYLLVQFDYFSRADDGYFDTVSYLGTSNSVQIANLDSLPLANLTNKAASFEVPEVYTAKGAYYDLLNNFDFRPAVANTVNPTTDANTAPLNPANTISFGNTADPANDKKFPLPDGICTTKVEQYIGRVDNVFIAAKTGEIYVLKGRPSVDPRKRYDSNVPKDTLKLHTLTVPAYPNITDHPSEIVSEIITTGVFNERSTNARLATHVITPILSSYEMQLAQPMVYTMEDIANLERRIKDLEYYVGLSILETSITNKIIPSSIDGSLNRFKFGFFADDFSTDIYSDVTNPQYAASIEVDGITPWGISKSPLDTDNNWANSDQTNPQNQTLSPTKIVQKSTNRCVPPKFVWSMLHNITNLPYIDEQIISQDNATDGPIIVANTPTANTPPPPIVDGGCTPKTGQVNPLSNGYYYVSSANPSLATAEATFGNTSGTVTMYFNHNNSKVKYQVFKNGTLVATTEASANSVQNLTANNKTFIDTTANSTGWIKGTYNAYARSGDYVSGSGKLSWTHNPSTGKKYDIQSSINSGTFYEYLVEYPLTSASTTATTVDPCIVVNHATSVSTAPPTPLSYTGTMKVDGGTGIWSCSKLFSVNGVQMASLLIECTGLKPNTLHKFYVDGFDVTVDCGFLLSSQLQQVIADLGNKLFDAGTSDKSIGAARKLLESLWNVNKTTGKFIGFSAQPLMSDASGKLNFAFYQPVNGSGHAAGSNYFKQIVSMGQTSSKSGTSTSTFGSSGYSTFMVQGPNSVATKLVAQRTNKSTIPWTPAGSP